MDNNRGHAKGRRGDSDGAIADYSAVIELPNVPPAQVVRALLNRGLTKGQLGDSGGAIGDYTIVIELCRSPSKSRSKVTRGDISSLV